MILTSNAIRPHVRIIQVCPNNEWALIQVGSLLVGFGYFRPSGDFSNALSFMSHAMECAEGGNSNSDITDIHLVADWNARCAALPTIIEAKMTEGRGNRIC
jgi:hypothetical protein